MTEYVIMTDISRYQGEVDFNVMASRGVKAVAIRATVGDYYTDPMFYTNWENAGKAGLVRTAYLVVRPDCSASTQFKRFKEVVGSRRPDFPKAGWVADCEVSDNQTVATVTSVTKYIVEALSLHCGKTAFIYTRFSYWNNHVKNLTTWNKYHLWIARYTSAFEPWLPNDPSYVKPRVGEWTFWSVWQWSADKNGKGPYYGAQSPDIDLNRAKPILFEGVKEPVVVDTGTGYGEVVVYLPLIPKGTYKKIDD